MKKYYLFLFSIFLFSSVYGQQIKNNSPEDCITFFFKCFHEKDTIGLKSVMHESASLRTIVHNQNDTILKEDDVQQFYKSIGSMPKELKLEEKLLKIKVREEGILAQVWTPYEFYINGELSHYGVNAFTLMNTDEGWKIIYLVDTRRKEKDG
tara:strand:+ start:1891 stop:2346 length:456 start_codon:yes stop_codon:yes gene_type:complete